ncbi:MAG: hypothetical protein WB952_09275 [Terriglobales bacterium]
MRCGKYLTFFAAVVMFLPLSAFARQKNEHTITLFDPATFGSVRLEPGSYQVEWTGAGSDVQVSVLQHKKTVATTTAQLITNDPGVTQDAVVLKTVATNSPKQIAEIDFGSRKEALVLSSNQMNPGQGQ